MGEGRSSPGLSAVVIAAAATSAAAALVAGCVGDVHLVVVTQRGGREQGQAEEFIIHITLPALFFLGENVKGDKGCGVFVAETAVGFVVGDVIDNGT